ncbi:MAG: hypothetical protein D3903_19810 [Candidatus Electrothrix sp. GM3_4]|nr:hypothetical protein [Candidatus Electrothrix sp. GM3_4]
MYRDWKVYIEDIITAIEKIERYTCCAKQTSTFEVLLSKAPEQRILNSPLSDEYILVQHVRCRNTYPVKRVFSLVPKLRLGNCFF